MNKVILMGRLTAAPELKATPNGKNVCSFTVAINRRFKNNETDFINCVAWEKTAEFICKYFSKGSMIAIAGSIQTRKWQAQDGSNRYAIEVLVEEAYFAERKQNDEWKPDNPSESDVGDFIPADNEDLPF